MSDRTVERSDLAEFLRQRRARLKPDEVGLPAGRRRRTPGLRREEVATLAGVGVTWYTWFEQGRAIGVSAAFLDRLSDALRLSRAERRHLFVLAGHDPPDQAAIVPAVTPAQQRMLDALPLTPAYVKTPRWDIIGWNRAICRTFCDYGAIAPERRNIMKLVFTDLDLRRCMDDWEADTAVMAAKFRVSYARNAGDPSFGALVDELAAESPRFRELWERHDVIECGEGMKRVAVPGVGTVSFEYTAMQLEGPRGTHAVIFVPVPGEPASAAYLRWIAQPESAAAE